MIQNTVALFLPADPKTKNRKFPFLDKTCVETLLQQKHNKEILLETVKKNGLFLQHASLSDKQDKDIVFAAVSQNGLSLQFADPILKKKIFL